MTLGVMIPGTLCDARVFEPLASRLNVDVIVADPMEEATAARAAEVVLAQAPTKFVAVGFSLGGFVALEMLRRAPERLHGIVMIASNPYPLAEDQADARRSDVAFARSAGIAALIERLWPRYVAPTALSDFRLRALIIDMASAVGIERFSAQTEIGITRPDSRDLVRTSRVPILWLYGEQDRMNARGHCQVVADDGRTRSAVLERVGHFIPLEAPKRAADSINAWAKDLAL